MTKSLSWLLLGLCALVALGGYFQVLDSSVFWCGRVEAFPGTTILVLAGLGQTALYLASAASPDWARPYRVSQWVVLPVLAIGLCQVFQPHPRTVAVFALLTAIPVTLSLALARWRWMRPHLPMICGFFVVSALGFLAAFGEIPLTLPGVVVPRWLIGLAAVSAAAVSIPVIGSVRHRVAAASGFIPDPAHYLPLALLLFPVLRGKFPDIAYDSIMYKTTLPYQLAEWLTGDTALIDGFMIGTNLQEMLNALLLVITRDYLPPLLSTISFVLLFLITPLAFPVDQRSSAAGRVVVAFAAVSAFVLSEAGIAQGTAYQEPMMLLFLVASLIRCPVWPAFLAVAIAVKISAAFIAPLVVVYHIFGYRRFFLSPGRLLTGALAGAIVLLPQLNRNVVFSGRILGLNETLASVTDPPGPHQVMVSGETRYDLPVRGGIANNAVLSACNMWLLSGLCPMPYKGNDSAGFHVFPASRAPLFAVLFAVAVLAGAGRFRARRIAGITSVVVFLACYTAFLGFFSQGRYFLPLSFGFSVLLLINPAQAEEAVPGDGPVMAGPPCRGRPRMLVHRLRPDPGDIHQRELDLQPGCPDRGTHAGPAATGDGAATLSGLVCGPLQAHLPAAGPSAGDPRRTRRTELALSWHAADLPCVYPADDPTFLRRQPRAPGSVGPGDHSRGFANARLCRRRSWAGVEGLHALLP